MAADRPGRVTDFLIEWTCRDGPQHAPPIELLIVDDDALLRQTLARRFQRQGLNVPQATRGEEALEQAAERRFDVALLDLNLPGISGVELLGRLKERRPELEALLLTAHGSIETAIQAMKRGAYDYLAKPFHLPELEVHIQKRRILMAIPHAKPGEVFDVRPLGPVLPAARTTTLVKTNTLEVIRLILPAGKTIPAHQVQGEITVQCLEGRIAFTAGDTTLALEAGQMLYLSGNEPHALRGIDNASVLVTVLLGSGGHG